MKKTKIRAHSSTLKPSTAWRKRGSQCIYERSALGLWVCLFIAFHPASKSRWSTGKSTLIAMWYNDMLAIWGTLKRKREANFLLSLHCGSPAKTAEMNLLFSVLRIVVVCAVMWFPAAVPLLGLIFCLFLFIVQVQVIFASASVTVWINLHVVWSWEMIEACTKGGGNGLLKTTPDRCFNHNFVFLYYSL